MTALKATQAMHCNRSKDLLDECIASLTNRFNSLHDNSSAMALFFELQGFRTGLYCIQPRPEEHIDKVSKLITKCARQIKPANKETNNV